MVKTASKVSTLGLAINCDNVVDNRDGDYGDTYGGGIDSNIGDGNNGGNKDSGDGDSADNNCVSADNDDCLGNDDELAHQNPLDHIDRIGTAT